MSFESLGLSAEIVRSVTEEGYSQPTPIQEKAIPVVLQGHDIMACAQTGTGKTAGFTLPLLQRLLPFASSSPSPAKHPVRALILTPTRELAVQVEESVKTYSRHIPLRSTAIYGGVPINGQIKPLQEGVEILVATPGRLLDHLQQRTVNLSTVQILVLDEADRMLDMGFMPDIRRILDALPQSRQSMLFSATFSDEIKKLANQLLASPVMIEVARRNTASETVTQVVHPVPTLRKKELLAHLVRSNGWEQVLVFVATRRGANRLSLQLAKDGIPSEAIHGDRTQVARMQALDEFKNGKVRVLVATDVAARGLDIDQLPHVVNFELPTVPEDYVHRIGRTGRAGSSGKAISLVAPEEMKALGEIERLIKMKIPRESIEEFEREPSGDDKRRRGAERTIREPRSRPATDRPTSGRLLGETESASADLPEPRKDWRKPEREIPALLLPPKGGVQ